MELDKANPNIIKLCGIQNQKAKKDLKGLFKTLSDVKYPSTWEDVHLFAMGKEKLIIKNLDQSSTEFN